MLVEIPLLGGVRGKAQQPPDKIVRSVSTPNSMYSHQEIYLSAFKFFSFRGLLSWELDRDNREIANLL